MKVVLLDLKGFGPTFLAEDPEREQAPNPEEVRHGFRSWIAAKHRRFLIELENPNGAIGPTVGRVWRSLQRLIAPDEYLFRSLRTATTLTIDYPAGLARLQVQDRWSTYLTRKLRKHAIWLTLDALLAPASLFLAIVPGPNVVGYWILYRGIVHGMVVIGILRSRQGRIPVAFRAMEGLDGPIDAGDHEQIKRVSETLEWPELGLLVERLAPNLNPE